MIKRPDIEQAVAFDLGYTNAEAKEIVDKVFDVIAEALLREEDVMIQGLMKLEIKDRPAHRFRNSVTGKMEMTKAGKRVKLKMSSVIRSKIDTAFQKDKRSLNLRDYDELYKKELPDGLDGSDEPDEEYDFVDDDNAYED